MNTVFGTLLVLLLIALGYSLHRTGILAKIFARKVQRVQLQRPALLEKVRKLDPVELTIEISAAADVKLGTGTEYLLGFRHGDTFYCTKHVLGDLKGRSVPLEKALALTDKLLRIALKRRSNTIITPAKYLG